MRGIRIPRWLLVAAVMCILWSFPGPARAQCAMCSTTLANSKEGQHAARSINTGILVLLIPPVAMMCVIFAFAFRRRNPNGEERDGTRNGRPAERFWRSIRWRRTPAHESAYSAVKDDFDPGSDLSIFPAPGAQ